MSGVARISGADVLASRPHAQHDGAMPIAPRPMARQCTQLLRAFAIVLAALPVQVLAGPPFRTDDPGLVPYGQYEVYLFSAGTLDAGGWNGVGPALEFNSGFHPGLMAHIVLPLAYSAPNGSTPRQGPGDVELGLKARLLAESGRHPEIGVFPLAEVPTGSASRGLGNGHLQFFLPVWVQKDWAAGRWTTYGGGGYWVRRGAAARSGWFEGALLQRNFSDTFFLGAELYHQNADHVGGHASTGVDIGGSLPLLAGSQLLWSVGRNFQNAAGNRFSYYLAWYRLF